MSKGMESGDEGPIGQTIALFRELLEKVGAPVNPAWMEEAQLTLPQLKTAMILRQLGELSVGRVAERLKVGEPTASHLIDRLVQSGLAERSEDQSDRRRTLVRLSSLGRMLVEERRKWLDEHLQGLFLRISAEELAAFQRGLRAILAVLKSEQEGPPKRERPATG